jgi:lysozyme
MRRVNSKGFARRIFHLAATRMKTSLLGIKAIARREGTILHVYKDSKGLPTAGVGHLLEGDELKTYPLHTKITQAQCDAWLAADLAECEEVVNGIGAKLKPNEFDALVSLAFNIGARRFARSTVAKRIKAGDKQAAAQAILWWDKPPEIQGRRRTEYNQFLHPYKESAAPLKSRNFATNDAASETSSANQQETAKTTGPPLTQNIADPTTEQNAAVVEKPLGFWATLGKKVAAAVAGIGGTGRITEYAQQAQTFGLSPSFWERFFYLVLFGLIGWVVIEVIRWFITWVKKRSRTDALVLANSTPNNSVTVIKPEQIGAYRSAGWVVIERS